MPRAQKWFDLALNDRLTAKVSRPHLWSATDGFDRATYAKTGLKECVIRSDPRLIHVFFPGDMPDEEIRQWLVALIPQITQAVFGLK